MTYEDEVMASTASNALSVLSPSTQVSTLLAEYLGKAIEFGRLEKSEATRSVYARGLRMLQAFCAARGVSALPATPETTAAFLAYEAERGCKPRAARGSDSLRA